MKNQLITLLVAICFVALVSSLTFVIAENDTGVINLGNNKTINMTFGKCVAESVVIRQGCYAEGKNSSKECNDMARLGDNKEQAKQCLSNYKENKNNCKSSFKEAKRTCIQTYKPGFWERMRHTFD